MDKVIRKKKGVKWKIFLFLSFFLVIFSTALKLSAPLIVERWLNQKGSDSAGYAFSIRDVELSFEKGQMTLNDVKIFNPKTDTEIMKAPQLTINLKWKDLLSQNKNMIVSADRVDLILSKDFTSEMERIKTSGNKQGNNFYLESVVGEIGTLNIIEKKEDQSRKVLELNNLNLKVKDVSLTSINKKTEFSLSSNIADGGKFKLIGKTNVEKGRTPWTIDGSLKDVPAEIFNRIAGDKLPFSFDAPKLNAKIVAHSDSGEISGSISPDITRLNLLTERPGGPTQSIIRALTENLTFTLPFTLKDELTMEYEDIYKKLKNYRRYPAANES